MIDPWHAFVANTLSRQRPLTIAVGKCLATLRTARRICQAGEHKESGDQSQSQVHAHEAGEFIWSVSGRQGPQEHVQCSMFTVSDM